MIRSTARADLAVHLQKQVATHDAIAAALCPVLEIRDRISAATATLQSAETALAAVVKVEADGIRECGEQPPADFSTDISSATSEVARCRRVIHALGLQLAEAEQPLRSAQLAAGALNVENERLVWGVLTEAAHAAIAAADLAGVAAAKAQANARSAIAAVVNRKQFKVAEELGYRLNKIAQPHWADVSDTVMQWDDFLSALTLDAGAIAPGVV